MSDELHAWRQFRLGAIAILPICVAVTPISVVWGAVANEHGLTLAEITLMSATVFAGASQFVAVGLWATPLPLAAIVFATLMVNLRHVMMSASLGRKMTAFTPAQRFAAFYGLVDEVWALAESRALTRPLTPAYYAGLSIPLFLCWNVGTVTGGVFGKEIGDPKALALDFVFAATFIALIVGFRKAPAWLPVAIISATISALTHEFLPAPWYVMAGGLSAVGVAAWIAPADYAEIVEP